MTTNPSDSATKKQVPTKGKKGPIRFEAVVPFIVVAVLTWAYFHFLFDHNLKSALEFAGYEIVGAEVNIGHLETSFLQGSFRAREIEVTNSEKPSLNLIKIGDVRYGVLWDGLLRARFVVNEMAVEQIEFNTPRSHPGKVKPPEPPKPASSEPSAAEKEALKLKNEALEKAKTQYSDNVLGDIAALLSGSSATDQLKSIEDSLPSKARLLEFEKEVKAKQDKWQNKLKTLPQGPEIQALGDRLGKVKIKDFKSPQELQESLHQFESIFKEADAKVKLIQTANDELNQDLKGIDQNYKQVQEQINKDIQGLQARFKIPQIDAKSITHSLFNRYMGPYLQMFNKYKSLAEKYIPPNLLKKGKGDDSSIKPHPRARGVTYEFGKPNSYPLFWIKRISVSSQAGATKEAGNLKGLITNISSNQKLAGQPTVASLEGGFPALQIAGLTAKLTINTMRDDSEISYDFGVGSYPIDGKEIINSAEAKIAFSRAEGAIRSSGALVGLRQFKFKLENDMQKVAYEVSAKNEVVDAILKEVFRGLPILKVEADGHGELPDLPLNIQSNLGPELQKGFEKQLQKKINEAKQKLQAAIDKAIGEEKTRIEGEVAKIRSQIEGELKKINDQIAAQKAQTTAKADAAKKDAEQQAKKKVEGEGQKAIDDLKKKLGF